MNLIELGENGGHAGLQQANLKRKISRDLLEEKRKVMIFGDSVWPSPLMMIITQEPVIEFHVTVECGLLLFRERNRKS